MPALNPEPAAAMTWALTLADPVNGKYFGPVDRYVTDGTQRYKGMIVSIRGNGRYGSTMAANTPT